ncbi:ALK tyrosine kinase receptor isoform X2 [Venturia canescens]|uniref:ALK tyrosine kinase receptor isoform X2 n=1 Tax=Venturia canescens TaxID=32260 RepID=UPI001C9CEA89|nr:ALK tyrosine kinase receptor isoform X2 [Venturia canescens]
MISEGTRGPRKIAASERINGHENEGRLAPTDRSGPRRNKSGSRVLAKILVGLCLINGVRSGSVRSFDKLKALVNAPRPAPPFGHCDFETLNCDWSWNRTGSFLRTNANATKSRPLGPHTDSSGAERGYFLWLGGPASDKIWSKRIPPTGARCRLEVGMHQVEMENGTIQMVIETENHTSWVTADSYRNNKGAWEQSSFNLGVKSQPYRVFLEFLAPYDNSSIAIDDIRLVDCFPESTTYYSSNCTGKFNCKNGSCLNKSRVCDLTPDCADGEDEMADCDKIPETARCNFEHGWCGWRNRTDRVLNWTLNRGESGTIGTGPSYDHTYRNETGTYAVVILTRTVPYGSQGTLESPIFNPIPPYTSDPKSPYYRSCQVRFFYHRNGGNSISLGLYLVQMKPHENETKTLWWSYGNQGNVWYNHAVPLLDIKYRYFFQFEASKGYVNPGEAAIDDFSLSPECFGIGVPPEVVKDFNYYNPVIGSEMPTERHADFANKTVVKVTTCGATGRTGPTPQQCAREYNNTDSNPSKNSVMRVAPTSIASSAPTIDLTGIQHWSAPRGGYYTLIAVGARGGRGSGGMGSTLGALVRGVIELEKGETLYFLVGQAGMDACPNKIGLQSSDCQQTSNRSSSESGMSGALFKIYDVKNMEWNDGGGGGGGATYVFMVKDSGEYEPILVAAGGGGLGLGKFINDGFQHGRGFLTGKSNSGAGNITRQAAGGIGGGWNDGTPSSNGTGGGWPGMSLLKGGQGGQGCSKNPKGHGDGGFGGGGGGCKTGGGGGGFIGGKTGPREYGNGEGGYSYVSPRLLHTNYRIGVDHGPGEVTIVPDISGCGCDFRCVALDLRLSETKCLCPPGWELGNDSQSCIVADESNVAHQTFMILLIVGSIILLFALSALCVLLYNRYQNRKALLRQRQVMFNGLDTFFPGSRRFTEYNPNYEFDGKLYSIKDLPQIPRDSISFVQPLGQGAFGEVFQGIYKYRRTEEHPVAVKTLPLASTPQALCDFMMEALIMSKFNHPNIVQFIGISFDKHPRYIILELLAGGDLKNFLREERPRPKRPTSLTMLDLIMCAHDVAKGCKYMESERFIHRDIAARNCLLTCKGPGRVVKIADFGMARDIYRSDYYKKGGKAMLPVKWMPPESFLDGIFTTKTDVWAFGVLLWEIMSFGYMPYTGCANREVISMVTTGGRLERPAGCPDPIYGLMTKCWHPSPDERPSFATILERIGYCLQDPDVINHPMPKYDILPPSEREIPIMRPDPETECINVHPDPEGCGYMQPRTVFWPSGYRMGPIPGGIVCPSMRHCDERDVENVQETTFTESKHHDDEAEDMMKQFRTIDNALNNCPTQGLCNEKRAENDNARMQIPEELRDIEGNVESRNLNSRGLSIDGNMSNGNTENGTRTSTTTESNMERQQTRSQPETVVSSPNTRTSSPNHVIANSNANNFNGIIRKNALKAALSLDPSTLYRGTIPYEKIAFTTPPARLSNPGSVELRKNFFT